MIFKIMRQSIVIFLTYNIISSFSRLNFKYLIEDSFKDALSRIVKSDSALLPSLMECTHCVFVTPDPSGMHAGIVLFHPQQEQLYDWLNVTMVSLNNTFSRNRKYQIVDNFILFIGRDWNIPHQNIANISTLAYSKRKGSSLLCIPWPLLHADQDGNEIGDYIDAKERYNYSWSDKITAIVWRGAPNAELAGGRGVSIARFPRYHVSYLSARGTRPWLDACVTSVLARHQFYGNISCAGQGKRTLEIKEMVKYKYILNIGGSSGTSTSISWKLGSTSLIFNVHSDFEDWFFHLLQPWKHYVPIKADLTDLKQNFDMMNEKPQLAKDIVENANRAMAKMALGVYRDEYILGTLSQARLISNQSME